MPHPETEEYQSSRGRAVGFLHHQLTLTVTVPNTAPKVIELATPHFSIGSGESNIVRIKHPTVSRTHCAFQGIDGRYRVRDLDSTNGTRIGAVQVREAWVEHGMTVSLGPVDILFQARQTWIEATDEGVERFGDLIANSTKMRECFALLGRLSNTQLSALITGETGTGKELMARALHDYSDRAHREFVVVDCGALHEELIESELFGHRRGAFTGAIEDRVGAFEAADGGTVFLDEVGELPFRLQTRLLRVLATGELRRIGDDSMRTVNVRVVAATHRNLRAAITEGAFREDLYYRLAEAVVSAPPLRNRREDIPLLIDAIASQLGHPALRGQMTEQVISHLIRLNWPGNVRELRNVVRRLAALYPDQEIDLDTLRTAVAMVDAQPIADEHATIALHSHKPIVDARRDWAEELEFAYLNAVLERFGSDLGAAAEHAGIHRKSFRRLCRQRGLGDVDS